MKRMQRCLGNLRAALGRIHLVDKCLIVFMMVLLLQSIYSLFMGGTAKTEGIDVIVRTSSAAIFGYFLSANFIGHSDREDEPTETGPPREDTEAGRLQILVAAGMGLFCLLTLLVLRNVAHWMPIDGSTDSAMATVTQFRDFISGCVGFLIGCPVGKSKK